LWADDSTVAQLPTQDNANTEEKIVGLFVPRVGFESVATVFEGYSTVYALMWQAVGQFQALHYKPEGRGFDSRWCHWNFSLT
jgi:hypothetical protein